MTLESAIPVTTVARTLFDLAAVVPPHQLESAMNEAEARRLGDVLPLPVLVARYPGRRGTAALKAILARGRLGLDLPRRELEARFLAFMDRYGLPRPEVNAHVEVGGGWIECDCVWRKQNLIVELDGHAFHSGPAEFERDRARDRALHLAGWRVIRLTWRQLHDDPDGAARDLRALLGADPDRK